ncbi:MAG: hypothetical protein KJ600_05745 [Nanoarchaeota archaeon]|nr:hypothetical protein [Nanoarchaeota archaeon]MBU1104032.1 hypothetical protein [Nanoarchaeota archaeon]
MGKMSGRPGSEGRLRELVDGVPVSEPAEERNSHLGRYALIGASILLGTVAAAYIGLRFLDAYVIQHGDYLPVGGF